MLLPQVENVVEQRQQHFARSTNPTQRESLSDVKRHDSSHVHDLNLLFVQLAVHQQPSARNHTVQRRANLVSPNALECSEQAVTYFVAHGADESRFGLVCSLCQRTRLQSAASRENQAQSSKSMSNKSHVQSILSRFGQIRGASRNLLFQRLGIPRQMRVQPSVLTETQQMRT